MIRIIAVGKMKEKWMKQAVEEYMKRLSAYEKMEIVEVADEPAPQSNSEAQDQQVLKIEGERLLKQIKPQEVVILLDLKGKEWTSIQMSKTIQDLQVHGQSSIAFVIGGSLGLSPAVIQRANMRWKLSDCTFPHMLCRILVLEQIYRSFRILHNEPYHK